MSYYVDLDYDADYVLYDWVSDNPYWERRYKRVQERIADPALDVFSNSIPKLKALGNKVRENGLRERDKELDFLRTHFPDFNFTNISNAQLITTINEIIIGKEQFSYALKRIESAINNSKNGRKGLAPSISAVFPGYLASAFNERVRAFFKDTDFTLRARAAEWSSKCEELFNAAVDDAIERVFTGLSSREGNELDKNVGDASQWSALAEAYQKLDTFRNKFKSMLRTMLDISKLKDYFDTEAGLATAAKIRRNKRGMGDFTKFTHWTTTGTREHIQGNVEEWIVDLVQAMMPREVILEAGKQTRTEFVISNKVATVDQGTIIDATGSVDVNALAEQWSTAFNGSSKFDIAASLREFYDRNLANLSKNVYMISDSTKIYALNESFDKRGFANGSPMPLEHLSDYMEQANINPAKVKDFIRTVYNSMDGAIYANKRPAVNEAITNILTSAAAQLLFDDWSTIGVPNPGAQMLHFFTLDMVTVPASVVLIGLGDAMCKVAEDLAAGKGSWHQSSWFKVDVTWPKTIVYHRGDWEQWSDADKTASHAKMVQIWNEQAKKARDEAKFSSHFLLNFKTLMKQMINSKI